jgi:predicted RNA methylase
MSVYESYDETSKSYDRTRVPVGSEIILGCLAAHGKALGEMTLLDAGCGTGAYAQGSKPWT